MYFIMSTLQLKEQFNNINNSTSFIKTQFNNSSKYSINECFKNNEYSENMCELISIFITNIIDKFLCEDKIYPKFVNNKLNKIDINKLEKLINDNNDNNYNIYD